MSRDAYPDHWWTPVPGEGAPAWEVLPQEAGPGEVILSKRHELGLLSSFAPTREKVLQNPEVQEVLLATDDLVLRPDHHEEPGAPPEWRYFEILTAIRSELRRTGRKAHADRG